MNLSKTQQLNNMFGGDWFYNLPIGIWEDRQSCRVVEAVPKPTEQDLSYFMYEEDKIPVQVFFAGYLLKLQESLINV